MSTKGVRMRHIGVAFVAGVLGITAIVFAQGREVDGEPDGSGSPSPTATPTRRQADDITKMLAERTIALLEAYYLAEPTETPDDHRKRVLDAGLPVVAYDALAYADVSLCSEQARQNQGNPLTQRAVITADDMTVRLPDESDPHAYVATVFTVVQVQANGEPYPGSPDCPAATELAVGSVWQSHSDGTWRVLSITPPEPPS